MKTNCRSLVTAFLLAVLPAAEAVAQRSAAETAQDTKIFEALGLKAGMTVCEVGAGSGEQALAAARIVGAGGKVYTSELGEERLKALREKMATGAAAPITVVAGDPLRTNFPEGACDAVYMRNVYHHFDDPPAMNASIFASMKPGALLAVLDFTPPDKEAPTPADRSKDGMHGVKAQTLSAELKAAGFEPRSTQPGNERWFIVVVEKPRR